MVKGERDMRRISAFPSLVIEIPLDSGQFSLGFGTKVLG